MNRTVFVGAALGLSTSALAQETDECPTDPLKLLPGVCGCEYAEVPTTDSVTGDPADACVHNTATLGELNSLGARSRIGPGVETDILNVIGDDAVVMEETTLGPYARVDRGAVVGARVRLLANAVVGADATVMRGAEVSSCAAVREGATIGRLSRVSSNVIVGEGATIGYNVQIPEGSRIGDNAVIGHLVQFPGEDPDPVNIGVDGESLLPAVVARGVSIGESTRIYSGAVIGPDSTIGPGVVIEGPSRLRKQVQINGFSYIEQGARIGRTSVVGQSSGIGNSATIGVGVSIVPGGCVEPLAFIPSRTTPGLPECTEPFNEIHDTPLPTNFVPNCNLL